MFWQRVLHWLLPLYLCILAALIAQWFYQWGRVLPVVFRGIDAFFILAIAGVYAMSHIFRMLRLAMLTLDERERILPVLSCHAVTALPSALLPFKIGEILRLGSFFYAIKTRKALSIWLAERFGDISVIALFILVLYFFKVDVPPQLRMIFILFFVFSVLALTAFFAVAKVFIYLNHHLVLSSHSRRGLQLLKISHQLRLLEESILRCVEGRFASIALLSLLIWTCEVAGIALFIQSISIDNQALSQFFLAGLSGVLDEDTSRSSFHFCRDLVLIAFSLFFGVILMVGRLIKRN